MLADIAQQFPGASGYLNTASIGLPSAEVVEALKNAIDDWQAGRATAPGYDRYIDESRELFAELVSVTPDTVAIGSQVSALVGMIATGLKPGTKVLCPEGEFTSVIFPFLARTDLDVTFVKLDELDAAIRPDIDLVAFSLVQSADGRVADGELISKRARECDVLTLVDTTQAAGWLPFDASSFDFTVTGAYKWLMSPRGSAFMTVREEAMDQAALLYPGWYAGESVWESIYGAPLRLADDARRFDLSPAWLAWVGTAYSLRLIKSIGVEKIHDHNIALANLLRSRAGLADSDSAIVSLALPASTKEALLAKLSTANRAGRLRVGFHLYSQSSDVELVAEALGI